MPGSFQAVYNATKAYLDTLSWAIRDELNDSGVTVTCLMPGPTDTEFFDRADMDQTPVGQDGGKADPADVARQAIERCCAGPPVSPGLMNKVQAALAGVLPDRVLSAMHRKMAEPDGKEAIMADAGLAVVTGASTGLGYELARRAVEDGYALVICADEREIEHAADKLRRLGGTVEAVQADLATRTGCDALWQRWRNPTSTSSLPTRAARSAVPFTLRTGATSTG